MRVLQGPSCTWKLKYDKWVPCSTRVSESETTVTRKGQVTIPAELRKKYGIREGMKVDITDAPSGLLLKPIPHMNDWSGADAGKYTYKEMVGKLDRLRRKWR